MPTDLALAGAAFVALCLYFLFAGADFGGGVWDLLASGARADRQRRAVERAIGPIWEANHVWLILVVVILFSAFPRAFAAISIALHVPLTLFLVGVVMRGTAFVFRGFPTTGAGAQRRWGLVFSSASTVSPVLLGMTVGALVSGRIHVGADGVVTGGFFAPWLTPFSLVLGAFALALCAFLAAVYLTVELDGVDEELCWDFRVRAFGAGIAVGVLALAAFLLSGTGAPLVRATLAARSWPFHVATGLAALAAFGALSRGRYRLARLAAAAQTVLILLGWAASQYPFLVVPDVTIASAAANAQTRLLLLIALGVGVPVLVPSLFVLFRVFKDVRASPHQ